MDKETFKFIGKGVGVVLLVMIGIFSLQLGGLHWGGFFGVEKADIERRVFETGKSYNEGKAQDLIRYKMQYMQASSDEKPALATMIRDAYVDFDVNSLRSESLRVFLNDIMEGNL